MSTNPTDESKSGISNGQKQKLKKYAVFALMGIICAGCMWLIFAPSAEEKAKQEMRTGFNADIPMPREEGMIDDKASAYEQEQIRQKQAERMRSLDDFSSLLGAQSSNRTEDLILLPDEPQVAPTSSSVVSTPKSVQNSVNAYRDMNRTLGDFYETPKMDAEKEELKKQVGELQARMDESENRKKSLDEQMLLMEKSFQMASKYLPGNAGTTTLAGSANEAVNSNAVIPVQGKTAIVPVTQPVEQTVSALPQEMSGKELMEALAQARNTGFLTAAAEISAGRKNTISACIHDDQTVMDGENVRLRLLEPMKAGKMLVCENTVLSGLTKIQGERLQITVHSMEYNGCIIPVEMAVYDTDGQRGIFIPDTREINAVKEIAANMGTGAGTSISLSSDAGEQFVADMGRSVIQGASQFFSKKMREVKVKLKAGYRVFLLPSPSNHPGGELAQIQ